MEQLRKLVERNSTLALVVSLYGISAAGRSLNLGTVEKFVLQGLVFAFFLYLQMSKSGGNTALVVCRPCFVETPRRVAHAHVH